MRDFKNKEYTFHVYIKIWISSILEQKHSSFHLQKEKLISVGARNLFKVKNQHLSSKIASVSFHMVDIVIE